MQFEPVVRRRHGGERIDSQRGEYGDAEQNEFFVLSESARNTEPIEIRSRIVNIPVDSTVPRERVVSEFIM